ncbi:MAG: hypothetical protein KGL39_20550 [Patescibacteria group bacterium]|nr:hypothetical protein [Patescibacteria group bacterium]
MVTARYADGAYETWVMGGKLDGWVVPSSTLGDAKATHCGAVQLVRESVELAEVQ